MIRRVNVIKLGGKMLKKISLGVFILIALFIIITFMIKLPKFVKQFKNKEKCSKVNVENAKISLQLWDEGFCKYTVRSLNRQRINRFNLWFTPRFEMTYLDFMELVKKKNEIYGNYDLKKIQIEKFDKYTKISINSIESDQRFVIRWVSLYKKDKTGAYFAFYQYHELADAIKSKLLQEREMEDIFIKFKE